MWSWVCRSCCWSSQVVWPKIHPTLSLKRLGTSINIFIWEEVAGSTDAVGFIQTTWEQYSHLCMTSSREFCPKKVVGLVRFNSPDALKMFFSCTTGPLVLWIENTDLSPLWHQPLVNEAWEVLPLPSCFFFFFWDQIRWTIIIIIYWGYRGRCQQCNTDAFCEVLLLLKSCG